MPLASTFSGVIPEFANARFLHLPGSEMVSYLLTAYSAAGVCHNLELTQRSPNITAIAQAWKLEAMISPSPHAVECGLLAR